MEKKVRPTLSAAAWILFVTIIVLLNIIHLSIRNDIKTKHDQTQMMVMDDLMDLRTEIIKLGDEILKLRLELMKHDSKPQWWEGSKDNE